ncbi:hypothetical protein [Haladaptatus sp. R4]|uniref:hypothetical protein n=1 Tax=Haladaptatus sp. R4 TaxID=1679489 RepID=UPI000AAEB0BB|nr:hypothetical protein [Haladaptatus sp. R4]
MAIQIGVLLAVAGLAVFHSLEPGHAWPVAGIWALNQDNRWRSSIGSGLMLSLGHILAASLFLGAFSLLTTIFPLHQYTSYIRILAGLALFYLAYRLYTHSHDHDHEHAHGDDPDHSHDHSHGTDHTHSHEGDYDRGYNHDHSHGDAGHSHGMFSGALSEFQIGDGTGLVGVAAFAFLLGLVHEEGYALVGFCAGTFDCIPIALTYAVCIVITITSLVVLTTATAARFAERLEGGLADYLPALSAFVLGFTGVVFVLEGLGILHILP